MRLIHISQSQAALVCRLFDDWWGPGLLLMMPSVSSLSAQCLLSKVLTEGYLSLLETPKDFIPAAWTVEAQMRAGEPTQLMDFLLEKQETLWEQQWIPLFICKQNMSDHQVSNPYSSEVDGVWIALITFIMFGHFLQLQHPNNIPNSLKLPTANHLSLLYTKDCFFAQWFYQHLLCTE